MTVGFMFVIILKKKSTNKRINSEFNPLKYRKYILKTIKGNKK